MPRAERPHLSCSCGWACVGDVDWVALCASVHRDHCLVFRVWGAL